MWCNNLWLWNPSSSCRFFTGILMSKVWQKVWYLQKTIERVIVLNTTLPCFMSAMNKNELMSNWSSEVKALGQKPKFHQTLKGYDEKLAWHCCRNFTGSFRGFSWWKVFRKWRLRCHTGVARKYQEVLVRAVVIDRLIALTT